MIRTLGTFLFVSAITVAGAVAHGTITGRWQAGGTRTDYTLPPLPHVIGGWKSEELKSTLDNDPILRNLTRKYIHPKSGRSVTVSLTLGPAGLTAQHTPEYCYPGSGYEAVGATQDYAGPNAANFRTAVYRKKADEAIRILWAWSPDGNWSAPKYPEMKFFHGALYKLYVVSWADVAPEDDRELQDFLAHLLTTLEQCLFPPADPNPAPPGPTS